VIILILLITAIYLNRSYAYFYDFLDSHKIMPLPSNSLINFKNQNSKTQPKLTYLALGDSLTYGEGVDQIDQTYPFLLSKFLSKKSEVELINLGIPGARTDEVIKLELPKLNDLKPNLITLLIGINDAQSTGTETTFKKNFQTVLDQITADPRKKVIVINIPALTSNKNMLPPYKYLVDLRISRFNSIIVNLVKEKQKDNNNLFLINLYEQTKQKFIDNPSLYSADYFHPSAKGYKLWSEIIINDPNF